MHEDRPPDGGVYELLRVRCGGNDSTAQVADSLVAPPELVCVQAGGGSSCTGTGDDVPVVVRLRMRVHDSSGRGLATYEATLSGERRQS